MQTLPSSGHAESPSDRPPPIGMGTIASRLLRRGLRRTIYWGMRAWPLVRPRLVSLTIIAVLLIIVLVEAALLIAPRLAGANEPVGRVAAIVPADAVEQFLRGQQEHDIELIWAALSNDLQVTLANSGASKEVIAAQLERERLAGERYRRVDYIGGVEIEGGLRMFFYVIEIESATPERNGSFSFVFTVDQSGKIVRLRM